MHTQTMQSKLTRRDAMKVAGGAGLAGAAALQATPS